MKAIIGGKKYDTTTATVVGMDSYGGVGDFDAWDAGLYVTRKGQFFLAGRGGPNTRWARSTGQNSWSGGSGIHLLDVEEAREWAERHLDSDTVEKFFDIEQG